MCFTSKVSPTCKLKTFMNKKHLSVLNMHYVNTTFDFWGNSLLEKGKYLVIESSYFCVE